MDVDGVRQLELVGRLGQRGDDLPRRDVEVVDALDRDRATLPACRCFHTSTPPGLTSLGA